MKLTLAEKKTLTSDVISFVWNPSESVEWKAGQYLHYVLHHLPTDDRGSDRWFTISSAPFEGKPAITTRFSEPGSSFKKALHALEVGAEIEASAVEGDFTIEDPTKQYVWIAGGIGITPFHSILKQADHDGVKLNVTLLYGNRNNEIVFKNELEAFAKNNTAIKIHYLLSPERIDEASIRARVPDLQTPLFYLSGPEPMVKALAPILEGMGVPSHNIKLDDFPGYKED